MLIESWLWWLETGAFKLPGTTKLPMRIITPSNKRWSYSLCRSILLFTFLFISSSEALAIISDKALAIRSVPDVGGNSRIKAVDPVDPFSSRTANTTFRDPISTGSAVGPVLSNVASTPTSTNSADIPSATIPNLTVDLENLRTASVTDSSLYVQPTSSLAPESTSAAVSSIIPKVVAGVCSGLIAVAILICLMLYLRHRLLRSRHRDRYQPGHERNLGQDSGSSVGLLFTKRSPYGSAVTTPEPNYDSPTLGMSNVSRGTYSKSALGHVQMTGNPNKTPEFLKYFRGAEDQQSPPNYSFNRGNNTWKQTEWVQGQEDGFEDVGLDTASEYIFIGPPSSLHRGRFAAISQRTTKYHQPVRISVSSRGQGSTESRTSMEVEIMYDPPLPISKTPSQIRRKPVAVSTIEEAGESETATISQTYSSHPSTPLADSDTYSYREEWPADILAGVNINSSSEPRTSSPPLSPPEERENLNMKPVESANANMLWAHKSRGEELPPPPVPPKGRELYLDMPRDAFGTVYSGLERI